MPLEKNTVRSVENFSTGTRGALSTEYFLAYSDDIRVIYFHRKTNCKMPFKVKLDVDSIVSALGPDNTLTEATIIKRINDYRKYKSSFLEVPFTSVQDYLAGLEMISKKLNEHSCKSLTYLAAAVSDFYLPTEKLAEHKIQSREVAAVGEGQLVIELDPVPKLLGEIKKWNPQTTAISFKLETDEDILETKAIGSIEKYGMNMVVANML